MIEAVRNNETIWKDSMAGLALLLAGIAILIAIAHESLGFMVHTWEAREEYSHGYLIPFISAFLIWQRKDLLEKADYDGSWLGAGVVVAGIMVVLIGNASATHVLTLYGFLIALTGFAYAYMGRSIKIILVPILFLFFMIPLPGIFLFRLSSELQLISSQLGVWVIRLFGISVYLEGNVIDLGKFQLQVVEACSGLRYLFPLISLSFIAAYFFSVSFWKRAVIVISSIPITIFMNSFRIGVIGVLVEYGGIEQAQGFLHDFEGWVVFMFSIGLLLLEMLLFLKFSDDKRPFNEVFGIYFPEPTPENVQRQTRKITPQAIAALALLGVALLITVSLGQRDKPQLVREDFSYFPMTIGEWHGAKNRLESDVLDLLKLDDYLIADYKNKRDAVNFYVAYYNSQEPGAAAHSPKTCLPGGGWRIKEHQEKVLTGMPVEKGEFKVNRFVIRKGEHQQVVYYWFQQRGRVIASEYMVKWYLLKDAITKNRTDGALVRITAAVRPGEDIADADARILEFARTVEPVLKTYIPQ